MFSLTARHTIATATIILFNATAAHAQRMAGALPAPPSAEMGNLFKSDRLRIEADQMMQRNRFSAARPLYRKAAELELAASSLSVETFRALANAYFYDRQPGRAAEVLDELATHAGRYGNVVAQTEAHIDAAWLYARFGDAASVNLHVQAARLLLSSPFLPEADRSRLNARVR